ncbi:Ig-like domain-containing protein [Photobacterium lipolyticum]|nr:Ig-like domain-containing protein [Photobacterium lipolyticum]
MYRPILMSVPLIAMLTACGGGSDSDLKPDPKKVLQKKMTFSGMVYDGPMADTTVSVFAGKHLLATAKTDINGKYSVDASISVEQFENIKAQAITYRAQREDIFLYQYAGTSLEEALVSKNNQTLITNFSTVEYVFADIDKNNFVTDEEWKKYQQLDSNFTELATVRYGVGLKSIIDESATLAGYENSTLWLRAVLNDAAWQEWHSSNVAPYRQAWDSLFADTWFLDQEAHRFEDISSWEAKHNYIVTAGPLDPDAPVVKHLTMSGIPQKVSVGDLLSPSIQAFWSDDTASDVSEPVTYSVSPADALVINNGRMQVQTSGTITLSAEYKGAFDEVTFVADAAVLASLRLEFDSRQQQLKDEWQVVAHGVHQNDYLVDFSDQAEWASSNPEIIESLGNGRFLSKGVGTAKVIVTWGGLTAEQAFDIKAKIIDVSLNLPNGTISREETVQLSLNGEFNDGSVSVITDEIVWSSSNPEFLTIDENGIATGITEGQSVVTATYQGFTFKETVTVIHPKIVSSIPSFVDGVLTLTEGDILEYGMKFVRSNGIEHAFTAADDGLDFESSGFGGLRDPSRVKIAEIDKDSDRIHAVRSGEDTLEILNVPVELQQIFVELGAITSADDDPTRVSLKVNVLDNADVYQWNLLAGSPPVGKTVTIVQAIQSGNTLYRFWQVKGAEQDGIYLTKVTAEGESAPVLVLAASMNENDRPHKLISNGIIHDYYDYVLLLTDSNNGSAADNQLAYRYKLSDGSLTVIPLANYPNSTVNMRKDSFAFTPNGDFVVTYEHNKKGEIPHIYHFETGTWEEKSPMPGKRIQTPLNKSQIAVLETNNMGSEPYEVPVLRIFDLETQQIITQEFVIPGDAEYFCRSVETMSLAIVDNMKDSGAGCMVAKRGNWDGIGYWLWDSIAELPKLHLFSEGVVQGTSDVYAVAYHKPDGHVVFSAAGVKNEAGDKVYDVAEIIDVEVDGVIEQQVSHKRLAQQGKKLEGYYNDLIRVQDGSQYTVNNADVPNESITVFNKGTAVRDEHGQWSSDKYMYQLPVTVEGTNKLYNLGNTIVLSPEGYENKSEYWLLQMREPQIVDEPVEPELPVQPEVPEQPTEPTPAQ